MNLREANDFFYFLKIWGRSPRELRVTHLCSSRRAKWRAPKWRAPKSCTVYRWFQTVSDLYPIRFRFRSLDPSIPSFSKLVQWSKLSIKDIESKEKGTWCLVRFCLWSCCSHQARASELQKSQLLQSTSKPHDVLKLLHRSLHCVFCFYVFNSPPPEPPHPLTLFNFSVEKQVEVFVESVMTDKECRKPQVVMPCLSPYCHRLPSDTYTHAHSRKIAGTGSPCYSTPCKLTRWFIEPWIVWIVIILVYIIYIYDYYNYFYMFCTSVLS